MSGGVGADRKRGRRATAPVRYPIAWTAVPFICCANVARACAIAAELGHSKTTIARTLSEPVDQQSSRRARVSLVDQWRGQIAEWLRFCSRFDRVPGQM